MTEYVKRFGVVNVSNSNVSFILSDNVQSFIESRRLVVVEDLERNLCWCLDISLCLRRN